MENSTLFLILFLKPLGTWLLPLLQVMGGYNLLPEHVELPHVLDLAVHLVQLTTWMGRGVILRLFPFYNLAHGPCDFSVTPVLIGL